MRRSHAQITDFEEISRILNVSMIGRMASIDEDGFPYITPVNFVFHEGRILFHSALKGEKLDNIARDPKVGFEVDIPLAYLDLGQTPEASTPCKVHQLFHSVVIRGTARVLSDGPAKTEALNALMAKHEGANQSVPAVTEDMPSYKICAVVAITPERISGKADLLQNKSPEQRLEVAGYLADRGRPGDLETARALGLEVKDPPEGQG